MKPTLWTFLALGLIEWTAWASPAVLDFSRSHTVEDLIKSGLQIKEIAGGADEQDFSFQNQEVEILLPAGRSIHQNVKLGIIDSKDGQMIQMSTTGDIMPHEQAVKVANLFQKSFGISLDSLNQWDAINRNKGWSGDTYGVSPILKYYPIVGLAINSSNNKLYPWVIRFEMQWYWKEQRDWNEERAWRELPPPPPQLATISLNAPSGLKYERKDAYKESLEAQAKLEQEQALKKAATAVQPVVPQTNSVPKPTEKSPIPDQSGPNWFLILASIVIIVLSSAVAFRFWKK
jgi:hypothetical protein